MLDVDLDKENAAVHELTASRAPLDMKRERRKANVVFGKHRPPLGLVHRSGLARSFLDRSCCPAERARARPATVASCLLAFLAHASV